MYTQSSRSFYFLVYVYSAHAATIRIIILHVAANGHSDRNKKVLFAIDAIVLSKLARQQRQQEQQQQRDRLTETIQHQQIHLIHIGQSQRRR